MRANNSYLVAAAVSAPQPTVTYTKVTLSFSDAGSDDAFDREKIAVGVNLNGSRNVQANLIPSPTDQNVQFVNPSGVVTISPSQTQNSTQIGLTGNSVGGIAINTSFLSHDIAAQDLSGNVFGSIAPRIQIWIVQDLNGYTTPISSSAAVQEVQAALPYWSNQANVNFATGTVPVVVEN